VKLRISLSFTGIKAMNVQVVVQLPTNIVADKNPISINEIKGNSTPYTVEVKLFVLKN